MAQAVKYCHLKHEEVGFTTYRVIGKNEWGNETALHLTSHLLVMGWESWQYPQGADTAFLLYKILASVVAFLLESDTKLP